MQFFYECFGVGQPYQRVAEITHVDDLFVGLIVDGETEEKWGASERLVGRDALDGTMIVGARKIEQYLRDMSAAGFQFVGPRALVEREFGCPDCGERRQDELAWNDDDAVVCQTCGCVYVP